MCKKISYLYVERVYVDSCNYFRFVHYKLEINCDRK